MTHDTSIVPVERLTAHHQRFTCTPFRSVITPRTCLARQEAARSCGTDASSRTSNPHRGGWSARMQFERCDGCVLGTQVARVLAGVKDTEAPVGHQCSHEGCPEVVHGFVPRKGVRPLCPIHRAPAASAARTTTHEPTETSMKHDATNATNATNATDTPCCTARGCTDAQGRVRVDTTPAFVPFCSHHRQAAHRRVVVWRVSAEIASQSLVEGLTERPADAPEVPREKAKQGTQPKKVGRAKKASKVQRKVQRKAPTSKATVVEPANGGRALRVVTVVRRLGGVDQAEQLATAVERAGGVAAVCETLAALEDVA